MAPRTAARIGEAARVSPGWSWPRYEPLVDFAIDRGWSVVAANLSRERTRPIVERGLAALGTGEGARLGLERTDSPARRAILRAALVEGHCGQDSPLIDQLVDVQRARDAVIADRLLAADAPAVVAIVGRGHARRDVGVPVYLEARAPGRRLLSLGMVEVVPGRDEPVEYPEAAPGRHDLVWFTAAAEREDPCRDFPPPK